MKFIVNTDGDRLFIEYVSTLTDQPMFYWEPENTPTIEQIIEYGNHTHLCMMNYAEYRRENMVYPWT